MRCVGELDKSRFKTCDDNFNDQYFKDYEKVSMANLETVFLLSQFKSDEDVVKMVALYFINNYLFFKDKGKLVDDIDFQMYTSGSFDEYLWGRSLFNKTLHFIQSQLKAKVLKVRKRKAKNEGKIVYETIKLYYFPLAIQTWLHHCIPILSSLYRKTVNLTSPRMKNWKAVI